MKFQIKSEFFYMFLFPYKKQIVDFLKRGGNVNILIETL